MIQYSIDAALQSGLFEQVVVSTDSEEVAEFARGLGAKAPMLRPQNLADDFTPIGPVLSHALREMVEGPERFPHVCFILATAPFIQVSAIREGYRLLTERKVASVYPVTTFPFPIFRALRKMPDGGLAWCWPEHELTRSNDLPETYHDVGQFYWVRREAFLKNERMLQPDTLPLLIPRHLVQDIDTPEDWERAERIYRAFFS